MLLAGLADTVAVEVGSMVPGAEGEAPQPTCVDVDGLRFARDDNTVTVWNFGDGDAATNETGDSAYDLLGITDSMQQGDGSVEFQEGQRIQTRSPIHLPASSTIELVVWLDSAAGNPFLFATGDHNQIDLGYRVKDRSPTLHYRGQDSTASNVQIPLQEWVYLAVTHDHLANEDRFYMNGELVAVIEKGPTLDPSVRPNTDTTLGRHPIDSPQTYNGADGKIKGARISDAVRSPEEIQAVYCALQEGEPTEEEAGQMGDDAGVLNVPPVNIAKEASITASSQYSPEFHPGLVVDGIIGKSGAGEWASGGEVNPWIQFAWEKPMLVTGVSVYDRENPYDHVQSAVLTFDDDSTEALSGILNDGTEAAMQLAPLITQFVHVQLSGEGYNNGLSEVEIFGREAIEADVHLLAEDTATTQDDAAAETTKPSPTITAEDVYLVGMNIEGGSILNTSGTNQWGGKALSRQGFTEDGFFTFTVAADNSPVLVGLSPSNSQDTAFYDICFKLYLFPDGAIGVYDGRVSANDGFQGIYGAYEAGDTFTMSRVGTEVLLQKKSGEPLFTFRDVDPAVRLYFKTAILEASGGLGNVSLSWIGDWGNLKDTDSDVGASNELTTVAATPGGPATPDNLAYPGNGWAKPAVAKNSIVGYAIHKPEHTNDGRYGNGASSILIAPNSWIKLDLGQIVLVDTLTFGRDRTGGINDRDPGQFRIEVAPEDNIYANGDDSNDDNEYAEIFNSASLGFSGLIHGTQTVQASFAPVAARFIKVFFANSGAAIDEIEVFGTVPEPGESQYGQGDTGDPASLLRRQTVAVTPTFRLEPKGTSVTLHAVDFPPNIAFYIMHDVSSPTSTEWADVPAGSGAATVTAAGPSSFGPPNVYLCDRNHGDWIDPGISLGYGRDDSGGWHFLAPTDWFLVPELAHQRQVSVPFAWPSPEPTDALDVIATRLGSEWIRSVRDASAAETSSVERLVPTYSFFEKDDQIHIDYVHFPAGFTLVAHPLNETAAGAAQVFEIPGGSGSLPLAIEAGDLGGELEFTLIDGPTDQQIGPSTILAVGNGRVADSALGRKVALLDFWFPKSAPSQEGTVESTHTHHFSAPDPNENFADGTFDLPVIGAVRALAGDGEPVGVAEAGLIVNRSSLTLDFPTSVTVDALSVRHLTSIPTLEAIFYDALGREIARSQVGTDQPAVPAFDLTINNAEGTQIFRRLAGQLQTIEPSALGVHSLVITARDFPPDASFALSDITYRTYGPSSAPISASQVSEADRFVNLDITITPLQEHDNFPFFVGVKDAAMPTIDFTKVPEAVLINKAHVQPGPLYATSIAVYGRDEAGEEILLHTENVLEPRQVVWFVAEDIVGITRIDWQWYGSVTELQLLDPNQEQLIPAIDDEPWNRIAPPSSPFSSVDDAVQYLDYLDRLRAGLVRSLPPHHLLLRTDHDAIHAVMRAYFPDLLDIPAEVERRMQAYQWLSASEQGELRSYLYSLVRGQYRDAYDQVRSNLINHNHNVSLFLLEANRILEEREEGGKPDSLTSIMSGDSEPMRLERQALGVRPVSQSYIRYDADSIMGIARQHRDRLESLDAKITELRLAADVKSEPQTHGDVESSAETIDAHLEQALDQDAMAFYKDLPPASQTAFRTVFDGGKYWHEHRDATDAERIVGRFLVENATSDIALAVGRAFPGHPDEVAAFVEIAIKSYEESAILVMADTGDGIIVDTGVAGGSGGYAESTVVLGSGNATWEGVFSWVQTSGSLAEDAQQGAAAVISSESYNDLKSALHFPSSTFVPGDTSIPGAERIRSTLLDLASHWSVELQSVKAEILGGGLGLFHERVLVFRLCRLYASIAIATTVAETMPITTMDLLVDGIFANIPTRSWTDDISVQLASYHLTSEETKLIYQDIVDGVKDWWQHHVVPFFE